MTYRLLCRRDKNVSYMYVVIVMRSKAKERNRVLEIDELRRDLGSWLL